MKKAINWFELFVVDMPRAKKFYEDILETPMKMMEAAGEQNAIFENGLGGGSLVKRANRSPSSEGAVVYLNCDERIDQVLGRVEKAGGKIVSGKESLGPIGFMAMINDTEGNLVGLHESAKK